MYSLWAQELLLLLIIISVVLLVYNTIIYFFNRSVFFEKFKLSLKYAGIAILIMVSIAGLIIISNKF